VAKRGAGYTRSTGPVGETKVGTPLRLRRLLVKVALVAAAAAGLSAVPAAATTVSGVPVHVTVQITKQRISLSDQGVEARGVTISFRVVNKDTKPHNFVFMGKSTATIKPGKSANLQVILVTRGRFRYESTVDPSHSLRGYFTVN
jgi:hypothetical protein